MSAVCAKPLCADTAYKRQERRTLIVVESRFGGRFATCTKDNMNPCYNEQPFGQEAWSVRLNRTIKKKERMVQS